MPMNVDEMMKKIMEIIPNAVLDEDNDGQIVIYTNLRYDYDSALYVDMGDYEQEQDPPESKSNWRWKVVYTYNGLRMEGYFDTVESWERFVTNQERQREAKIVMESSIPVQKEKEGGL